MNALSKKITALASISVLGISSFMILPATFAATDLKVGDAFKMSGINAGKNPYVLQILKEDLNKDKKSESIYLIGSRYDPTSIYYDQITYVIKDGKTGKTMTKVIKDSENANLGGYEPRIAPTDLNADGQKDLFLSAPTGGSGGYVNYDLSTMKDGKLVSFLGAKNMKGIDITGKFLDHYMAEFTSKVLNKTWKIDLSHSKAVYQDLLYHEDGKTIGTSAPYAGSITNFEVVDFWGKKMLKGYQDIKGTCEADTLATLAIYMVYEKNEWRLVHVEQTTVLKTFE